MSKSGAENGCVLEAVGLEKRYGSKVFLNDLSVHLFPGETLGLVGHNGSGKSTLLSILAQTSKPDAGALRSHGRSVLGDRAFLRQHVGYVPQQPGLPGDLKVERIVRYWQSLCQAEDEGAYQDAVMRMGLSALLSKRASQLSGGQKQRVSIALAILNRPKLLLLDEAMSALDVEYRAVLSEYIRMCVSDGGAVILCSHMREEIARYCDRVLMLRGGAVAFYGSREDFFAQAGAEESWI